MYFACLLKNAVYEVYLPKNKENVNIYPSLKFCYQAGKMTLNIETSNEAFENKLPFSVLLCMRVYKVGKTDSDVYEIEFIDV